MTAKCKNLVTFVMASYMLLALDTVLGEAISPSLYSQVAVPAYEANSYQMVRIAPATGLITDFLGTPQTSTGLTFTIYGLAYNSHDGLLYSQVAVPAYETNSYQMVRIDPTTGLITDFLGTPQTSTGLPFTIYSLTYNSQDGLLYSQAAVPAYETNSYQMVRIDPATGLITDFLGIPKTSTGVPFTLYGLAYNSHDGFLYSQVAIQAYESNAYQMVRIDPVTGLVTDFLGTPQTSTGVDFTLYSLAYVPEPSTFVLMGFGLGGLALLKGRRLRL